MMHYSLSEGYKWGFLLERLGVADDEWQSRLVESLDVAALRSLVLSNEKADLYNIDELIRGIYVRNQNLGLDLAELAIPTISNEINLDPIKGYQQSRNVIDSVLGFIGKPFLRREPSRRQRQIARNLAREIDADSIVQALSSSQRRDWEEYQQLFVFISKANPQKAREIAGKIDYSKLDQITGGLWGEMPRDLGVLIWGITILSDWRDAGPWVNRHAAEIRRISSRLAAVAPEAVAAKLRSGHSLNLFDEGGTQWSIVVLALAGLGGVDKELSIKVIHENQEGIGKGFSNPTGEWCKGLPTFVKMLKEVTPDVLEKIFSKMDPATVEKNWSEGLRGKAVERKAVATLIEAASAVGALSDVVSVLRVRFPQATRFKDRKRPSAEV